MDDKTKSYIDKAIKIHNNKYSYELIEKLHKRDLKVNIICPIHGEFEQSFHKHLCGDGCKKCGIENIKLTIIEKAKNSFSSKASLKYNNKYDYSKVNYINAITSIIIICPIHGEFQKTPNRHLNGEECGKCISDKNKNIEIPNLIEYFSIHNNKYDYSKAKYINATTPITIICPIHGEFNQEPYKHKNGKGCNKCSKISANKTKSINFKNKFIENSLIKYNHKYDYSKVNFESSNINVKIICPTHGEFEQTPYRHLKGEECKKCLYDKEFRDFIIKNNIDTNYIFNINYETSILNNYKYLICKLNFNNKASHVHNNKYDYSKVNYINAITPITIICPIHGEFEQTPNNHLRGKGCFECGILISAKAKFKDFDEYYQKFIDKYGDKYDYSQVEWLGGSTRIKVICKNHGPFMVFPFSHLKNKECPKCNNQYSKIGIQWLNYLQVKFNIFIQNATNLGEYNIPNTRYKADGYCKENNTIYEFLGDFWHGNPKIYSFKSINPRTKTTYGELYNETTNKKNIIKEMGYNYIEIWESDWKNFINKIVFLQRKYRVKRL